MSLLLELVSVSGLVFRFSFQFNDALLYTTPVQSGMYKLNNMLSLAGMKVCVHIHVYIPNICRENL